MMMIRRLSARSALRTKKVQSDVILHFSLTDETQLCSPTLDNTEAVFEGFFVVANSAFPTELWI